MSQQRDDQMFIFLIFLKHNYDSCFSNVSTYVHLMKQPIDIAAGGATNRPPATLYIQLKSADKSLMSVLSHSTLSSRRASVWEGAQLRTADS